MLSPSKLIIFTKKARLYDVSIKFPDYNIRRELLTEGVTEHKVKLFEGPLPTSLIIGLMSPDAFDGDFNKSSMKFDSHDIDEVDLRLDNLSLVNFPMNMKSENYLEFYLNYLKVTNRFENVNSTDALSYGNFKSNFMIHQNLAAENMTSGQLIVRLKFKKLLVEKLYLVYMPIYEKTLSFDSHLNASVTN